MKKYIGLMIVSMFVLSISLTPVEGASDAVKKYMKKCKICHNVPIFDTCKGDKKSQKKMGANFTGIASRTTKEWMTGWIKDSKGTWAAGGGYTDTLKKRMGDAKKTKMAFKFKEKDAAVMTEVIDYVWGLKFDEKCNGKKDHKAGFKG